MSRRHFLKGMAGLTGAVLATGALGACAPAPAAPAAAPAKEEGAAPAAAGLAAANLSVWVWWPDPVKPLQQMADSFMATNTAVKVTAESPADYWPKLQTALAGGAGPDVYFMNNVNYWSWANKGVLVDLTPLVESNTAMQDNIKNSWQGGVDFYNFKGKQFGLPYMYTTVILYYNEDYIKAQGLTPPAEIEDTFDWTQFRDYALKLTKREGDEVKMWGALTTGGIETSWLNFMRANGGDFLNADSTKCIVDEPASVEAWQFLADMRLKDQVSPSSEALQAEDSRSMFMTGKLPLWPDGSWVMNTLNSQLTDFKYNIAILPMAPATKNRGGTTNIVGLVMNNGGKAKDQSWALMTHLLSKDSQDILARANVLAPVRNDSAELYYDPALGPANRKAAFKMQQWTKALPTHEKVTFNEMMQPATEWETEIFQGRVAVPEGLQKMAAAVNDLFAKAG
jgi:multiple sugar transport system substrate-binding protein